MADGKPPKEDAAEKAKAPREIKDAGQRIVFAGLDLPSEVVVKALKESIELPPLPGAKAPSQKEKEAELKRVLQLLADGDGPDSDPTVTVWVRVGKAIDGGPTKPEAVEAAVDKVLGRKSPGRFRAPTLTHWRGEMVRRAPTAVPLDEEVRD